MGQSPCSCDRGPAVNTQTITGDDGDKASVTETTGNATYEGAWLDGQKHGHGVLIGTLENVKKTLYFCCFPPTYRFLVVFFKGEKRPSFDGFRCLWLYFHLVTVGPVGLEMRIFWKFQHCR